MSDPLFNIKDWRVHIATWKQLSVLDAKTVFDCLQGDGMPEDKRVAIDVSSMRADLEARRNCPWRQRR